MTRSYLRYAALGDSTTVGVGDPVPDDSGRALNRQRGTYRGWAKHLADALGSAYDVSFCNLAVSGATVAELRELQLADAVAHRPDVASLMIGINDSLRSSWDADRMRTDLLAVAATLHGAGATLMTARFHDHGEVLGLPGLLRRPLSLRICQLNAVYDEVHRTYGGIRVDLAGRPELFRKDCWSIDRFHPSEIGHRHLALAFAGAMIEAGYDFDLPSITPGGGFPASWQRDVGWLAAEGVPWLGRRCRDLGPWAARKAAGQVGRVAPAVVLGGRVTPRPITTAVVGPLTSAVAPAAVAPVPGPVPRLPVA